MTWKAFVAKVSPRENRILVLIIARKFHTDETTILEEKEYVEKFPTVGNLEEMIRQRSVNIINELTSRDSLDKEAFKGEVDLVDRRDKIEERFFSNRRKLANLKTAIAEGIVTDDRSADISSLETKVKNDYRDSFLDSPEW